MKKSIQFFRYVVTGGITTLLDIFLLYFAVEFLGLSVVPWATGFAFIGALLFSFVVNSAWTFSSVHSSSSNVWRTEKFFKFFFISLVAFFLTMGLMWIFTHQFNVFYLIAKVFTSLVVLVWNFLGNSLWTFSDQEKKSVGITVLPPEEIFFPYSLSIIIPAYNEELRLKKTLEDAHDFFLSQNISYEIIVVNDGSIDKTVSVATSGLFKKGKVVSLEKNQGKGAAIARGVQIAQGRYILFCDADGATPFSEYSSLIKMMDTYHIAIGSRYLDSKKEKGDQPIYRIFFSRLINFFAQVFLIDGYADTQCGFKLFRSESAKKIFSQQKIFRYAFDIECLVLAKKYHYDVVEVGVEWFDQEGSKFSGLRDGLHTVYDFIRIKFFMMFRIYS